MPRIEPWLALGVFLSTAATDAVYVLFNAGCRRNGACPLPPGAACVFALCICRYQLHEELDVCGFLLPRDRGLARISR
jgi:hypothetical protein